MDSKKRKRGTMQKHHRTPCEQVGGYVHTGMTKKDENKRRDEGKEGRKERQTKQKREKKWDSGYATQRNAKQKTSLCCVSLDFQCLFGIYIAQIWRRTLGGESNDKREKKRND